MGVKRILLFTTGDTEMENSKFLSACGRPPRASPEDQLRYGARAGVAWTPTRPDCRRGKQQGSCYAKQDPDRSRGQWLKRKANSLCCFHGCDPYCVPKTQRDATSIACPLRFRMSRCGMHSIQSAHEEVASLTVAFSETTAYTDSPEVVPPL